MKAAPSERLFCAQFKKFSPLVAFQPKKSGVHSVIGKKITTSQQNGLLIV